MGLKLKSSINISKMIDSVNAWDLDCKAYGRVMVHVNEIQYAAGKRNGHLCQLLL